MTALRYTTACTPTSPTTPSGGGANGGTDATPPTFDACLASGERFQRVDRDLNNGTTDEIPIDDKPDNEFQTNFPMTGGGSRYGASVKGASDKVINMRLPVNHHVTYVLVFLRR